MLQSSLSSLKVAQTKFNECHDSLGKISSSADNTSKDVLVPLTSSVSLRIFACISVITCTCGKIRYCYKTCLRRVGLVLACWTHDMEV